MTNNKQQENTTEINANMPMNCMSEELVPVDREEETVERTICGECGFVSRYGRENNHSLDCSKKFGAPTPPSSNAQENTPDTEVKERPTLKYLLDVYEEEGLLGIHKLYENLLTSHHSRIKEVVEAMKKEVIKVEGYNEITKNGYYNQACDDILKALDKIVW